MSQSANEIIALSTLTTMRIGGPARVITINDRDELKKYLEKPHRWLGRGANLVVADAGLTEPVLRLGPGFAGITCQEEPERVVVTVGAATDLAELIGYCCRAGYAGPEGLAGVPASVGGALRMNAGTAQVWMVDLCSEVEIFLPGESTSRWLSRKDIPSSYRHGGFPPGSVVLGCRMALPRGDAQALRTRAGELKRAKAASQPLALASAGCVFKNPLPTLPAGRLIDELGLKGSGLGGVVISPVHGNFIVNPGRNALAQDFADLVRWIRRVAWLERGVRLQLEVETWDLPADLRGPVESQLASREPIKTQESIPS